MQLPRVSRFALFCLMFSLWAAGAANVTADESATDASKMSPFSKIQTVPPKDVRWEGGFWGNRFELCRHTVVPHLWQVMHLPDNAATFHDLEMAAGLVDKGQPGGRKWSDGDCHKCVETMAHLYEMTGDPKLDEWIDEAVSVISKAQQPDGYLSSWVQLTGTERWADLHNHELYNMGHLMTAACVHHRATGKDSYLKVAERVGDYLYSVFAPRPKELAHFGFNPSNIMGAVDLYRTTGNRKYLELAKIFVDMRGSAPGGSNQNQAAVPLRKEQEAVGHGVTATYLWCGAADVYAETGEKAILDALQRLWIDVAQRKMYITGGMTALHHGEVSRRTFRRWPRDSIHEAFGEPYQLPNRTAYNETCANIGNAMWNWRLLRLTGESQYAEVMERVLYNSMLSSIGIGGTDFFYTNPLRRCGPDVPLLSNDSTRRWADTTPQSEVHCFCCPPNVARRLASLHTWAYSVSDRTVWVNLYGNSSLKTHLPSGESVSLIQETDYPWDGMVTIQIQQAPEDPIALMLRIPEWARDAALRVNDQPVDTRLEPGTYARVERSWSEGDRLQLDLPMEIVFMQAHPLVEPNRNHVAVMRGPVVYCLESVDLPSGVNLEDVAIVPDGNWQARRRKDLLGDVVVLEGDGRVFPQSNWEGKLYQRWVPPKSETVRLQLIPYYAWANRGLSEMAVWLPVMPEK